LWMSGNKNTYYIWLPNGQISRNRESSPWNFRIEATDQEITRLREYFDENYSNEIKNFYRAHVPYLQYHFDRENDAYDETLYKVYEMIYELGDEEARSHIDSMGILGTNPAARDDLNGPS
jgi:hypothetical protein